MNFPAVFPLPPLCLAAALALAGAASCGGAESSPVAPATTTAPYDPQSKLDDTTTVDIESDTPTKVLVDGKPAGTTPVTAFKVSPGSHDVTFLDDVSGNRTMTVSLAPGDAKTVKSDRPPSESQRHEKPK